MSIATPHTTRVPQGEAACRIQFADAALAVAGHEITDPALRELTRQVAAGEITAEDAIREGTTLIDAR